MSNSLYVLIHIYKTGGQTLRRNFELNFRGAAWLPMYTHPIRLDKRNSSANPGWDEEIVRRYLRDRLDDRVKCIFGHMAFYGLHELPELRSRDVRYIIFLRDPVKRIVSLYNYLRDHSTNVWHDEIVENDWSIDDWLQNSKGLWLHNGQLRQLLLVQHREVTAQKELTQQHLKAGLAILERMWFIGLTEHLDFDAGYLYGKLGFRSFYSQRVVNASQGSKEISQGTRQRILRSNLLDLALYRQARVLRQKFYDEHRLDTIIQRTRFLLLYRLSAL